jgi:ADP-ribose pyrophosphatase YjhB (NUDIX family)
MATGPQFTSRIAARVVLLDPANRVLLFRYVEPWSSHAIWATPGGGLEPGETDAAAARREVVEETGLTDFALSPIIWTRESIFDWGAQHVHQHERFFMARIGTWELPSTLWQAHQEEGILSIYQSCFAPSSPRGSQPSPSTWARRPYSAGMVTSHPPEAHSHDLPRRCAGLGNLASGHRGLASPSGRAGGHRCLAWAQLRPRRPCPRRALTIGS